MGGFNKFSKEEKSLYGGAKIFQKELEFQTKELKGPCMVFEKGDNLTLPKEEISLLSLGPKFCLYNKLVEENFEGAVEECMMKIKWDLMGEE